VRYWKSCSYTDGLFSSGWRPPHPTFFVRRRVYEQHGIFDLSYRLAADAELMMRMLAARRVRAVYVPRVWVKMRLGGVTNNSIYNIIKQNVEISRAAHSHRIPFNFATFIANQVLSRVRQYIRARV
jgi:hypothetical protein